MGAMTFADVVKQHRDKMLVIEDLERALDDQRGGHGWEDGIEKDARHSVKLLYGDLKRRREELANFAAIRITGVENP